MSGTSRVAVVLVAALAIAGHARAARQMENLGRGLVALRTGTNSAYIGWRMLGTDTSGISFNLYRSQNGGPLVKLNAVPLTSSTNMNDSSATGTMDNTYCLRSIINGVEESVGTYFTVPASATIQQYIAVPLRDGGAVYAQMGVGDLDGDGEYEYIVKWSSSPGTDPGSTHIASGATMFIDAYELSGAFMWRVDLGWNIELGDDYTPVLVYDIDGDGKAEVMTRTAEGTTDGTGVTIGDTDGDGITDYRDAGGRVLSGPEFLSIYRGIDGRELARTDWPARGNVSDWGDSYGNRVSRHLMGIAYVDGVRPSIVACHGVYALQKVDVWNYRGGSLAKLWSWTNGGTGPAANQCLRMGDVDGDGRDEIIKGCFVLDDDGSILYDTGLGHGDSLVLSVLDPNRAGLQIFTIHEGGGPNAVEAHDAATGTLMWGHPATGDPSRGPAAHIDPRYTGVQCWAGGSNNLYNYDGSVITADGPSTYWTTIFWNEDLRAEIISDHSNGYNLATWDYVNSRAVGLFATGAGRVRIGIVADVLGDWREELLCVYPNEFRVYTTTTPATSRYYTFMHDPIYRLNSGQWAMRNAATALPGFYFGTGMSTPPTPDIWVCHDRQQTDLEGDCQTGFSDYALMAVAWLEPLPLTGDIVTNGDFATGIVPWASFALPTASGSWSSGLDYGYGNPPDAAYMLCDMSGGNVAGYFFYQVIPVTPGTRYKLSAQWMGDLAGGSSDPLTMSNWTSVTVTFESGTDPAAWHWTDPNATMYKKVWGIGSLNTDPSGAWGWESVGLARTNGSADDVYIATDSYMVVAFSMGGIAGVGSPWVDLDNIKVEGPGCPTLDFNSDCSLDMKDFAAFAEQWLTCNRNPAVECWK